MVVGVSDYSGTGLADLPACAPEARAVAEALSSEAGCAVPPRQVHLLPDTQASAASIAAALKSAAEAATPDEIVVFYFAGHGEARSGGFVLRTGPRAADPEVGLDSDAVQRLLTSTRARGVLLILDCCGGAALAENAPDLFRNLGTSAFRILISASRSGQSSWERAGRGSPFTQELLRCLKGEEKLGPHGEIYFTDLFSYLHSAVTSDRSLPQEPVFTGVYGEDPLLFLNRELTLDQVRVRLRRLTPGDVRRRVGMTIIGAAIVVSLSVGSYWTFLDGHQFLQVKGDVVAVVHGYPQLSGFGLPTELWTYPLAPGDFDPTAFELDGMSAARPAAIPPDKVLIPLLKPSARVRVHVWRGEVELARSLLLPSLSRLSIAPTDVADLLPLIVRPGDEASLEDMIQRADPIGAEILIRSLRALDGDRAAAAVPKSAIAENVGRQLNLLAEWSAACGPNMQAWIDGFLANPTTSFYLAAVAQTALRTNCRLPLTTVIAADGSQAQSALFWLRIADPADAEDVRSMINRSLTDVQRGTAQVDAALAARLASFARYIGGTVCAPALLDAIPLDDEQGRMDAAVALSRDCPGVALEARVEPQSVVVFLRGAPQPDVLSLPLSPALGGRALAIIDGLVEGRATNAEAALWAILTLSRNPEVRLASAKHLRLLRAKGSDALDYMLEGRSDLAAELLRWAALTDPARAFEYLQQNIAESDITTLAALAFIPLDDGQRSRLLEGLRGRDVKTRCAIEALILPAEDVATLLSNPDPLTRASVGEFLLGRRDWPTVIALADKIQTPADPTINDVKDRGHLLASWAERLGRTPPFAVRWIANGIEQFEVKDAGLSLGLALLVGETDS